MHKRTKRTLLVIVILLLLALAALFIWRSLRPGPVAEFVPPVILPEIQSLDDLEQYTANKPIPDVAAASSLPALDPYDHLYGDPEADIVAILYTNMRNPYAKLMTDAFKTLAEEDPSIAFVYRHYAYENPAEDLQASQLSECVFLELDDSAYWAFLSHVQSKEYDLEGMLISVTDVGGDAEMARTCVETRETWNYVLAQRQQAELVANIDVSPSVVLWRRSTNDVRVIPGANPMTYIEETIADMR